MKLLFHGMSEEEIDVDIGDMIKFIDVGGSHRSGVLCRVEKLGFPRYLTYLYVLEGEKLNKLNTNLVFKCKIISKVDGQEHV